MKFSLIDVTLLEIIGSKPDSEGNIIAKVQKRLPQVTLFDVLLCLEKLVKNRQVRSEEKITKTGKSGAQAQNEIRFYTRS